jgi:mono/diheme cytochrome c family protein
VAAWFWLRAVGPRPVEELLGASQLVTVAAGVANRAAPSFVALALLVAWISSARFMALRRQALTLLLLLAGAGVGAAEVARVGLSGPWTVGAPGDGWLQANGLTRDEAEAAVRSGLSSVRPEIGPVGAKASRERGGRIHDLACAQCHSARGLGARLDGWPRAAIAAAVARLDRLSPASPPFPGNAADARDLALRLALLDGGEEGAPVAPPDPLRVSAGKRTFEATCTRCHREIRLERRVAGWNEPLAYAVVGRLYRMNPAMPRFDLDDAERRALAAYLVTLGR